MSSYVLWGTKLGSDIIRLAFCFVSLSCNLQFFKFMKVFQKYHEHSGTYHLAY